jgi:TonB family protein
MVAAQMQAFIIPQPVGGRHAMDDLITVELNYPENALEAGITGTVWLKFIVRADGQVEDLRIWQGLEPACEAEALRLARCIQWEPARVGDAYVDAEHSMAVTYSPKLYSKWVKKRHQLDPEVSSLPVSRDLSVHPVHRLKTPPAPLTPGQAGFNTWWQKNLKYPPEALRRDIQGPLTVRFVVEPSGHLSNLHAVNDLGGGCIPEAFRMLRSIPWRPGVINNERVRTQMEMEIVFKLP